MTVRRDVGAAGTAGEVAAGTVTSPAPRRNVAERLWSRVDRTAPGGCWVFTGYCCPRRGYGQIGRGGRAAGLVATHRLAWELTYGPIPPGMFICHRCDNPPCVNPAHLFLGTPADNVADMTAKGRHARGKTLPQTKLTDAQVSEIRRLREQGLLQREIAERVGATQGYVSTILSGKYRAGA